LAFRIFISLIVLLSFQCSKNVSQKSNLTLKIALKNQLDSLDPILSTSETSGIILSMIHRKLYKSLYNGKIVKDLVATEKTIQNKIFITIKKNSQLNERDILFSLNRLKNSGRQQWILKDIKSIKIKENNIIFSLTKSKSVSLKDDTNYYINKWKSTIPLLSLPQCSIYSQKQFTQFKLQNKNKKFSEDGDFKIIQSTNQKIKLISNSNYQMTSKVSIPPSSSGENTNLTSRQTNTKIIEFNYIKDDISKWFFFKKKMLDIFSASGIYKNFIKSENINYKDIIELNVLYGAIVSNNKKSILSNKNRQAINFLFDRKVITKKVLLDSFEAADYPVPPLLHKKLKEFYIHKKSYIFKNTRQETIIIYSPSDRNRQLIAMILKDILSKMNLKVILKIYDMPTLIRFNNQRKPGIYLLKWIADYPHAENFLIPLFHSKNIGSSGNRAYFQNRKIDKLLDNLRSKNNIQEIQEVIREEAPWLFIGFAKKRIFIHKPWKINYPITYTSWNNSIFQ